MSRRRKNDLKPLTANAVSKILGEPVPDIEEAEKLFYSNERAKNRSLRTIDWHKENIHVFKKAMKEQNIPLNLAAITQRIIKNNLILYAIDKWGNQPQTVNMKLRTLKQFFRYLVEEGYLTENPAENIETLKTKDTLVHSLSPEQIRKMLSVPDRKTFTGLRDYTLMLLLLDTGLRLSEVSGLLTSDINFSEGFIKVLGKGSKERTVPLQGKLKKVLKTYLAHRGTDLSHDYCFVTIDNTPWRNRSIQERLELISGKAGITEISTSPHIWRHTFARLYILNGGDPFSLKKILGHKSWEMVHRYVNLFGSQVNTQHKKASPVEHLDGI